MLKGRKSKFSQVPDEKSLQAIIVRNQEALQVMKEQTHKMAKTIHELKDEIARLSNEEEITRLKAENDIVKRLYGKLLHKSKSKPPQVGELIKDLQSKNIAQEAKIDQLEEQIKRLKGQSSAAANAASDKSFKAMMNDADGFISPAQFGLQLSLECRNNSLEKDNKEMKTELAALQSLVESFKATLRVERQEAESKKAAKNAELIKTKKELSKQNKKLAVKDANIANLKRSLATKDKAFAALKKKLVQKEQSLAEKEKKLALKVEEYKVLTERQKSTVRQLKNSMKCAEKTKKGYNRLGLDKQKLEANIKFLEAKIEELVYRLANLVSEEGKPFRPLLTSDPAVALKRLFDGSNENLPAGCTATFYLKGGQQDYPGQTYQDIDVCIEIKKDGEGAVTDWDALRKIVDDLYSHDASVVANKEGGYITVTKNMGGGRGSISIDLCFYARTLEDVVVDSCRFTSGAGLTPLVQHEDGFYYLKTEDRLFSAEFKAMFVGKNAEGLCSADDCSQRRSSSSKDINFSEKARALSFAYLGSSLNDLSMEDLPFLCKTALRAESRCINGTIVTEAEGCELGVKTDLKERIKTLLSIDQCKEGLKQNIREIIVPASGLSKKASRQGVPLKDKDKKRQMMYLFTTFGTLFSPDSYFELFKADVAVNKLLNLNPQDQQSIDNAIDELITLMDQQIKLNLEKKVSKLHHALLALDRLFYSRHLTADHWLISALQNINLAWGQGLLLDSCEAYAGNSCGRKKSSEASKDALEVATVQGSSVSQLRCVFMPRNTPAGNNIPGVTPTGF